MPDPIRQEITTSFDGSGIDRAIESTRELGEETTSAAERGRNAAKATAQQEQALEQLVAEELAYRQRIEQGDQATEESTQASKKRQEAINSLAGTLNAKRSIEAQAAEVVGSLTDAQQRAARAEETRAATLGEMRQRLTSLVTTQQAYEKSVAAGESLSDEARDSEASRRGEIERLATAIRKRQAEEDKTSQAVRELTEANTKAASAEDTRAQRMAFLSRRHEELIREQVRYERSIDRGRRETDQSRLAEARRATQIDRVANRLREQKRVQDRVNDSLQDSETKTTSLGGATGFLTNQFRAAVTGLIGAGGLAAALRILGEELETRTEQTRELAEATLNLQFLGDSFNPQERDFVGQASQLSGRRPVEVAEAYTQLKSRFPDRSDGELQTLFLQIAETAITTNASLTSLTDAFAGIFSESGDAQQSQNIQREVITQAGVGDPDQISQILGKALGPLQKIGNLNLAQSAGTIAAITGVDTRRPEEQVTGLRSVLLSLFGDLSDEQRETVAEAGIDTTDFLTAINSLGLAIENKTISPSQLDQLVGSEGVTTVTALGDRGKRDAFNTKVQAVVVASETDRDLTAEAIDSIFGDDPVQAKNFANKVVEARKAVAESTDDDALRSSLARGLAVEALRKEGAGPIARVTADKTAALLQFLGFSDEAAIGGGVGLAAFGDTTRGVEFSDAISRVKAELESVDKTGRLRGEASAPSSSTGPVNNFYGPVTLKGDPRTAGLAEAARGDHADP